MKYKGMYGLPQAGILAKELLSAFIETHRHHQSNLVHGLWKHKWWPIQFAFVVDVCEVKYMEEKCTASGQYIKTKLHNFERMGRNKIS